ncbi:hypothetical protein EYF80_067693 [Liparis tanakae]|uniref:Uncharacterized protein n=1 Tax=Liparis tanakae TaxID=230148 RepID=A0A4Z2E098_9TELE|nr:hypothetical protein EYF80_067693 [Liparis tanakae]
MLQLTSCFRKVLARH